VWLRTSWLPGFPLDGKWQPFGALVLPDAPAFLVGGDEIRRAERAPVEVPRDIADKVVDRGWADTLRWLLARAKDGALSESAAERYRPVTRKAFSEAPPALADAISWWRLPDPQNERLARRFADLGLDARPWVGSDLVVEGAMPDGATFSIRLEHDPLEVLRMGEHFETCLSPGGVNWFSAVANAADWHRRVAFARGADGAVIGRVLVCLTEQGGLLSFGLYAHRHEPPLEDAMAAFVRDLATKMGTAVVARGQVPLGVAPRWYDDGPADRTGSWPALDEGSEFRVVLRTVAPADLREAVARAFDPAPPTPVVLGWLVGLPEVWQRVDLLRALVPDADGLSDEDPGKLELYRRLYVGGDRDEVVRWARAHAADALRARWTDPTVDWLFDLALEQFPGHVLRWVRALSPCVDCGFERDGFAAWQAARACEALYRPVEARRFAGAALSNEAHSTIPYRFEADARRLAGGPDRA